MFEFLKEIKKNVNKLDKLSQSNNCMTNPFNKVSNQTFVWLEKPALFKQSSKH